MTFFYWQRFLGTHYFEGHIESAAFAYLTFDSNFASHLLNDLIADTETQAAAQGVDSLLIFELSKIEEEILEFVLGNSDSEILNTQHKCNVADLLRFFIFYGLSSLVLLEAYNI